MSEKNYLALKRIGCMGDSFNDVISKILSQKEKQTNSQEQHQNQNDNNSQHQQQGREGAVF